MFTNQKDEMRRHSVSEASKLSFWSRTYLRIKYEMKTQKTSSLINPCRLSQLKVLAAAIALVSSAMVSRADHFYTNNASGDFNVPANWDPNSVPNDNTHNNNGTNNVVLI